MVSCNEDTQEVIATKIWLINRLEVQVGGGEAMKSVEKWQEPKGINFY
ncbi:hypothetical protein Hanom_Chr08g00702131 [Helianthus anomalus]